jgi:NADH-quinone oxidoreductase subunit M
VIFAAAYLLWSLQRIIYEKLDKPENQGLKDLSGRELAILVPIVVMIFWIGVYPKPFLNRMEPSITQFIEQTRAAAPAAPAASRPMAERLP